MWLPWTCQSYWLRKHQNLQQKKYNSTTVVVVDALNHIDLMYKNYILNRLDNTYYDVIVQSIMQKYYGKLYTKSTELNKVK
jgi:hypothetical protein